MNDEVYFVASESDEPSEMFFDKKKALASIHEYEYIDSFDAEGQKLCSYKRVETGKYTTNF